jgi:hypothetical protein
MQQNKFDHGDVDGFRVACHLESMAISPHMAVATVSVLAVWKFRVRVWVVLSCNLLTISRARLSI